MSAKRLYLRPEERKHLLEQERCKCGHMTIFHEDRYVESSGKKYSVKTFEQQYSVCGFCDVECEADAD